MYLIAGFIVIDEICYRRYRGGLRYTTYDVPRPRIVGMNLHRLVQACKIMANSHISDLLRFLSKDARVPLAVAMGKTMELQKANLTRWVYSLLVLSKGF